MVIIQPFQYEKTTAFKERVQIANKVNEIINLFNELDIESKINIFNEEIVIINTKITEINNALNEVNSAVNTVEGYNTRLTSVENESISLDARLDNIEPVVSSNTAKIGVLENKDLENVKLSGNQTIENIKTFSSSPIVPNPPNGDTSTKAVNTNWISQTGDSSPNNLAHRTGDETFNGWKTITNLKTSNLGTGGPFNLANGVRAVAKISSYGIQKYNDIHFLICERSNTYYAHIYSGSTATISTISFNNLTNLTPVVGGTLDFKVGVVKRDDGEHLVIEHLGGNNRIFNVIMLCASRGGSTGLILEPDDEIIDTNVDTVNYYLGQGE